MRVRKGLGFLSLGIASGTVLVIPAAIGSAASAASHDFNSTATAKPGFVAVGGNSVTNSSSVTATDSSGPQGSTTGTGSGTSLPGGLGSIVPSAALVSTKADASRSGTSDACSAVASAGCGSGTARPLTVDLSLATVLHQFGTSLPISLPGGLDQDQIVLTLTGPAAACAAGPAGGPGNDFTAKQAATSGTVDIENGNGGSLIGGARQVNGGDVLSGLTGGMLGMVLGAIPANTVTLNYTPGSTGGAGSGPQSKAAAGKLTLGVGGTSAVSLVGGAVSCGANQASPGQTVSSSSPVPPGGNSGSGSLSGTGTGGSSSTSSEKPLSGIQSDEGRYVPASSDTPLWAGLAAGGAALAGGAGGLARWRRRRLNRLNRA